MSTPREDGFRRPGSRMQRCWMAWPSREELWAKLEPARTAMADVADAIADFEPVTMIARPDLTASVSLYLGQGVAVLPLPHDDCWIRDTCPAFFVAPTINGPAWPSASTAGEMLAGPRAGRAPGRPDARACRRPHLHLQLVLDGGRLQLDGEGTALLCEASILDPDAQSWR